MLPVDQSVPVRVTHGLGAVARADLRQHVVDVAFHRRLTDHETLGDLGVGFGGLSGLPHWLNALMSYLPAQPMIDGVTRALESGASMSGRDLAVLAAWAVGCLLLSVRFFRWDPTRPRHARAAGAGNPARSV
jgi:hypothetical protein